MVGRGPRCGPRRDGSVEEVEVPAACLHGVDDEFVSAVEAQHHDFEEAASGVEAKAQLPRGLSSSRLATNAACSAAWRASSAAIPCFRAES